MAGPGDAWTMRGEGLVVLARSRGLPWELPDGVSAMPGPSIVTALRYTDSTVGPFLELSIAVPARVGGHVGWCRTLVVVDRPEVRTAVRAHWGLPVALGSLRWLARDDERELVWEERDFVVRGTGRGPVLPWASPQPLFLERHHEPVVAPGQHARHVEAGPRACAAVPRRRLGAARRPTSGCRPAGPAPRGGPPVVRTGHLLAPGPLTGSPEPVMASRVVDLA